MILIAYRWYDMIRYDTTRYDTIRYDIWYDMVWYDTIRYDTIRYDTIRYDMLWYGMIRYDTIRYDTIRYDTTRHDTIWYDMIWYDMIWYDMIWYDMMRCDICAVVCRTCQAGFSKNCILYKISSTSVSDIMLRAIGLAILEPCLLLIDNSLVVYTCCPVYVTLVADDLVIVIISIHHMTDCHDNESVRQFGTFWSLAVLRASVRIIFRQWRRFTLNRSYECGDRHSVIDKPEINHTW